jgi:hypothetical protein
MRLSLLTLFTFLSTLFFAQTNGKGIVIIKDKKIDELIENKSNIAPRQNSNLISSQVRSPKRNRDLHI